MPASCHGKPYAVQAQQHLADQLSSRKEREVGPRERLPPKCLLEIVDTRLGSPISAIPPFVLDCLESGVKRAQGGAVRQEEVEVEGAIVGIEWGVVHGMGVGGVWHRVR